MKFFLQYGIPPLIPLFLSLCAGITAGNYFALSPILLSATLITLLTLLGVFTPMKKIVMIKNKSDLSFLFTPFLILLFFISGYYIIHFILFPQLPQNHISNFADKTVFKITGKISSRPEHFNDQVQKFDQLKDKEDYNNKLNNKIDKRLRCDLSVQTITDIEKNITLSVTGVIQINIYNPLLEYKKGDTIEFDGKIKSLRNFNNPGGFDYVQYMKSNNIWGRVNVNGKSVNLAVQSKPQKETLDNFRSEFVTHIFNNIESPESGAILCALITGNKKFISKNLSLDFSRAGGSHILAISGLHLSIVATLFFYIFNFLLSHFQSILVRGWSKKGSALLTLFPVAGYAVLSGYSDATERALIMIIVFMAAAVIERENNSFNSLAAAGIIILLIDPLSLFKISFQLSFSAVFFILMGISLFNGYNFTAKIFNTKKTLNQINNARTTNFISISFIKNLICSEFAEKIIKLVVISMCAIAGTQLLVMRYFNIFSFSGVLINIILIPCIGFGVLPLGLAALFIHPFSSKISGFIIQLADVILTPCIKTVKATADTSWSCIETFTPDILEIICYYLFMVSIFITVKLWRDKNSSKCESVCEDHKIMSFFNNFNFYSILTLPDRKYTAIRYSLVMAALLCLIFLIHEGLWIKKRFFNKNLCVTILDVGQGNCAFIEMPKGKTVLVDGGGFSYGGKFDTGKHIIAPFLRQKKILSLDAVILTHPDSDHINGLVYIFENFKVGMLVKNCDQHYSTAYRDLVSAAEKNGSKISIIDDVGQSIKISSGEFCFFHPLKACEGNLADYSHKKKSYLNNNSLVFKVVFKNNSILFPGDIMADAEKEILYNCQIFLKNSKAKSSDRYSSDASANFDCNSLKSDILIAPHHGSSGSSSDIFLNNVEPEYVIISCGWQNRFGFPRNIVLNRYEKRGIKIFRTDLNGAVNLCSDGNQWSIRSFL